MRESRSILGHPVASSLVGTMALLVGVASFFVSENGLFLAVGLVFAGMFWAVAFRQNPPSLRRVAIGGLGLLSVFAFAAFLFVLTKDPAMLFASVLGVGGVVYLTLRPTREGATRRRS